MLKAGRENGLKQGEHGSTKQKGADSAADVAAQEGQPHGSAAQNMGTVTVGTALAERLPEPRQHCAVKELATLDGNGTENGDACGANGGTEIKDDSSSSETETEPDAAVLEDIERQVVSHNRHPAEWDPHHAGWFDEAEPAEAYVVLQDNVLWPLRPREAVCELLGAGFPLDAGAHLVLEDATSRAAFVLSVQRLVSAARQTPAFASDVAAAVELGALEPRFAGYIRCVLHGRSSGLSSYKALRRAALEHPEVTGTMSLAHVESWNLAMSRAAYIEVVGQNGQGQQQVERCAPVESAAAGNAAEQMSSYLTSLFHQEMQDLENRRASLQPPHSGSAAIGADAACPVHPGSSADGRGTQGTVGSESARTHARVGLSPASAARYGGILRCVARGATGPMSGRLAVLLAQLPPIPSGCVWGYASEEGKFYPLDERLSVNTHSPPARSKEEAAAQNPKRGREETSGSAAGGEELRRIYGPALWRPDQESVLKRARLSRDAAHMDSAPAPCEHRAAVAEDLRREHFAKEEVRLQLRECALAAMGRIARGAWAPREPVAQALDTLRAKIKGLNVPSRDAEGLNPESRV